MAVKEKDKQTIAIYNQKNRMYLLVVNNRQAVLCYDEAQSLYDDSLTYHSYHRKAWQNDSLYIKGIENHLTGMLDKTEHWMIQPIYS